MLDLITDFDSIQVMVDKFVTPADVGRIPSKISAKFVSFTADQWKNWALIYSLVVLKNHLSQPHYDCWCVFVDACYLQCSRAISISSVEKMDSTILNFCHMFQRLYGEDARTPNLHLHCHLKECFLDFGPAGSFWTFAFERLNGVLGSIPTNHRDIETQIMRWFNTNQQVLQQNQDKEISKLFHPFQRSVGSLKQNTLPELPIRSVLDLSTVECYKDACILVPPIKESCLSADEHSSIEGVLKQCLYANTTSL